MVDILEVLGEEVARAMLDMLKVLLVEVMEDMKLQMIRAGKVLVG